MGDKFKVVIVGEGTTVNDGEHPKDRDIQGLDKDAADRDAAARNRKAEDMGLKVRYEVIEL